jgi:hypothetical protein
MMAAMLVTAFAQDLPRSVPPSVRPPFAGQSVEPQSLLTAEAQNGIARQFAVRPRGEELHAEYVEGVRASLASGIDRIFGLCVLLSGIALLAALVYPRIELARWDEEPQVLP